MKNDIPVMVWFKFDDEEDENEKNYERIFNLGVDCLCCNRPDKAKKFRDTVYNQKK